MEKWALCRNTTRTGSWSWVCHELWGHDIHIYGQMERIDRFAVCCHRYFSGLCHNAYGSWSFLCEGPREDEKLKKRQSWGHVEPLIFLWEERNYSTTAAHFIIYSEGWCQFEPCCLATHAWVVMGLRFFLGWSNVFSWLAMCAFGFGDSCTPVML